MLLQLHLDTIEIIITDFSISAFTQISIQITLNRDLTNMLKMHKTLAEKIADQ